VAQEASTRRRAFVIGAVFLLVAAMVDHSALAQGVRPVRPRQSDVVAPMWTTASDGKAILVVPRNQTVARFRAAVVASINEARIKRAGPGVAAPTLTANARLAAVDISELTDAIRQLSSGNAPSRAEHMSASMTSSRPAS
jgi:hypothetical protein